MEHETTVDVGFMRKEMKAIFVWKERLVELSVFHDQPPCAYAGVYGRITKITHGSSVLVEQSNGTVEDAINTAVGRYIARNVDETRKVDKIQIEDFLLARMYLIKSGSQKFAKFGMHLYNKHVIISKKGDDEWINEDTGRLFYKGEHRDNLPLLIRQYFLDLFRRECSVRQVKAKLIINLFKATETAKVALFNIGDKIRFKIKDHVGIVEKEGRLWCRCAHYPQIDCTPDESYEKFIGEIVETLVTRELKTLVNITFDLSNFSDLLPNDEYHLVKGFENNGNSYFIMREKLRIKLYKQNPWDTNWVCERYPDMECKNEIELANKVLSRLHGLPWA
jgi:hypothetical protein